MAMPVPCCQMHRCPARQCRSHVAARISSLHSTTCSAASVLNATALNLPNLCFGTMLFGESTDYPTAEEMLAICVDHGVNFFDTAEMYPVPQRQETQGDSERYLGRWLKSRRRQGVIISTKVAGPSGQMAWIRGGPASLDAANITAAIDGSLQRLQTDYVDICHLHWPDRYVPMFGDTAYDPSCSFQAVSFEEQLEALGRAVAAGKVRTIGLSNETPYGLMRFLNAAARDPTVPRVAVLQNAYSLTCRTFEGGLAECCHQEGVALLAYSPLAMGLLTGKYMAANGGPPGARLNRYKGRYAEAESRYGPKPNVREAVREYCIVARQYGMTPTELAIRFVLQHQLVTSTVVGATSPAQLHEIIGASSKGPLPDEVTTAIDVVHQRYPNPTP